MKDYEAEEVYESFQDPEKCEDLIRMLCNSGMLSTILAECSSYVSDQDYIDIRKDLKIEKM